MLPAVLFVIITNVKIRFFFILVYKLFDVVCRTVVNNKPLKVFICLRKNRYAKSIKLLYWSTHLYDKKLSTYKYDVYTYNYGGNAFWGSGPYTSHIAVKKNKEELIKWKEGEENKKRYYFKISAEDFLPSDKTLEFLE